MGLRRFAWLLALALGCAHSGNGGGAIPPAPECFPWMDLKKDVPAQSAAALLQQIKVWAEAANLDALAEKAERRKVYRFTYEPGGGNPAVVYGAPHGWARVLVAYRYAELAQNSQDSTLKAKYFDCAYKELCTGGEEDARGWAAAAVFGPAMTAGAYLDQVEQNALGVPAPAPYLADIPASVKQLKCRHGPKDKRYDVDLADEVLWARVALAYYLSEYSTPSGVRLWYLCSKELDYIED